MFKQKDLEPKKCAECSSVFSPWRGFQQFCSRKCGQKKHLRNYWKRKIGYEPIKGDVGPGEVRP